VPAADARIEVVFARPERQRIVELPLGEGMTARQAVEASGLVAEFPEIAGRPLVLGVFGRRVEPEHVLAAGDRVEIYRPLPEDPKERRRRAAVGGPARRKPGR